MRDTYDLFGVQDEILFVVERTIGQQRSELQRKRRRRFRAFDDRDETPVEFGFLLVAEADIVLDRIGKPA